MCQVNIRQRNTTPSVLYIYYFGMSNNISLIYKINDNLPCCAYFTLVTIHFQCLYDIFNKGGLVNLPLSFTAS